MRSIDDDVFTLALTQPSPPGERVYALTFSGCRVVLKESSRGFLNSGFEFEEVLQDLAAVLGENAFGMELHSPDGKFLVLDAHDFAFFVFGGGFECVVDES